MGIRSLCQLRDEAHVELWGNADLVECDATDHHSFGTAFTKPVLLGRLFRAYFPVVSFGFHRDPRNSNAYTEHDAKAMQTFLHAVFAPHPQIEELVNAGTCWPLRCHFA